MYRQRLAYAIVAAYILGLCAACGGSDNTTMAGSGTGTLILSLTDTPVEGASQVVVAFTGVDLMGPGGQTHIALASEKSIDLITLQGNASTVLLDGVTVKAGDYQWLRLDVDEAKSFVFATGGGKFPLDIPSGSQSGLKLVSGFTVVQGGGADFIIDFDLRQSLTLDNSGGTTTYTLKPALRLTDMQQAGSVTGTVASTLSIGGKLITATSCKPTVYVYSGTGIIPEGYDVTLSGGTVPLTSAQVTLDSMSGNYVYTVGFLAPGTYTLAVTCASADVAGQPTLAFSAIKTATVTANNTTMINF
jgi:uncharacterized protein DUF4382